MAATPRRYEVTDEEWERIKHHFEGLVRSKIGRPRNDDRQMLNGVLWIARSGASWRDLPERYGAWSSVYRRFKEWEESGLFQAILEELVEAADLQDLSLDSTIIKAHQASAGAKKGTWKIPKTSTLASAVAGEAPRFMLWSMVWATRFMSNSRRGR